MRRFGAVMLGVVASPVAWAQQANLYSPNEVVAFEDRTDAGSDADQNDLAVRVNARCRVNGSGALLHEEVHLVAVSAGASKTNAVLFLPPAVPTTVTVDLGTGPVARTPGAQIELVPDARQLFVGAPEGFLNTAPGTPHAGVPITVYMTFAAGPVLSTCPKPALALSRPADAVLITDATALASGQPVVGRFPDAWQVPEERVPVSTAYPQFLGWLDDHVSGCTTGCVNADWYAHPGPKVVARPGLATEAPLQASATCTDGTVNQDETGTDCGGGVCGACGQAFRYWRLLTKSGTISSAWNVAELDLFTQATGGTPVTPTAPTDIAAATFYSTTVAPSKAIDNAFGTAYGSQGTQDNHFVGNGTDWLRLDLHTPTVVRRVDVWCTGGAYTPSIQVQGSGSEFGPWTDVGPIHPGAEACAYVGTPAASPFFITYPVQ